MELAAIAAALPPSGSTRALALRREWATENGVADGIRTHDNRNHNPAQTIVSWGRGQLKTTEIPVLTHHTPDKNPYMARTIPRPVEPAAACGMGSRSQGNSASMSCKPR